MIDTCSEVFLYMLYAKSLRSGSPSLTNPNTPFATTGETERMKSPSNLEASPIPLPGYHNSHCNFKCNLKCYLKCNLKCNLSATERINFLV